LLSAVCLRDYRDRGYVRSIEGPGQYNLWEFVKDKNRLGLAPADGKAQG
jgi:hypothetical protein